MVLLARADSDGGPSGGLHSFARVRCAGADNTYQTGESLWGPVIEAYGIQRRHIRLQLIRYPPLVHKPGTVGRSAEISVIDDKGQHLGGCLPEKW